MVRRMQTLEHNLQDMPNEPDGDYGWVCVAACFTINAFSWGVVSVHHSWHTFYWSKRLMKPVLWHLSCLLPFE